MKGLLLCLALAIGYVSSEYSGFRDFQRSETTRNLNKASRKIEDIDYSDDFYDYFNLDPVDVINGKKRDELSVADDVLKNVKKPKKRMGSSKFSRKSGMRYPYKKRHDDNIAMPSKPNVKIVQKRIDKPYKKGPTRKQSSTKLPSFAALTSKVERLIPGKLKTVIEGEGKKIVKTVLQPVRKMSHEIKDTLINRNDNDPIKNVQSKVSNWLTPYRSYLNVYSEIFNEDYVVRQMVGLWVNCVSASVAWMAIGAIQTGLSGRSFEDGRSAPSPRPWDDFAPDSDTMAVVFKGLADVAERWHDEL